MRTRLFRPEPYTEFFVLGPRVPLEDGSRQKHNNIVRPFLRPSSPSSPPSTPDEAEHGRAEQFNPHVCFVLPLARVFRAGRVARVRGVALVVLASCLAVGFVSWVRLRIGPAAVEAMGTPLIS